MPRWMLGCPNCRRHFPHKEIVAEGDLVDLMGTKPNLPYGGFYAVCPDCKNSFLYQRSDLIYNRS
jgi:hypothetical protein